MDSETGSSERVRVSKELVDTVKKYIEIDNALKEIRTQTKKLNDEKKKNQEFILNYLQKCEEETIDITGGTLKRDVKKQLAPLKKENIQATLSKIIGDGVKASAMVEEIYKSRPIVEKVTLRRIRAKD